MWWAGGEGEGLLPQGLWHSVRIPKAGRRPGCKPDKGQDLATKQVSADLQVLVLENMGQGPHGNNSSKAHYYMHQTHREPSERGSALPSLRLQLCTQRDGLSCPMLTPKGQRSCSPDVAGACVLLGAWVVGAGDHWWFWAGFCTE